MGCFYSKAVRCSRCNRRSANDLEFTNNICEICIQIEKDAEYRRRLLALRDERTPATVRIVTPSYQIRPSIPQPPTELSWRKTNQPRYVVATKKPKVTGRRSIHSPASAKPLFGEYKCPECKHTWKSRRSWRGTYQKCQRCLVHVYPYLQRELRKSDMTNPENPHPEHLCEKCIRLGYNCSNFNRSITNRRT